ncbi:MAG: recombinase family protein [Ruminococcus sp.]|nr:recombinase family protein [Ruminococcus sp.]
MARIVERVNFNTPKIKKQKRVAAYTRVSSGKDAMLHSLSAQVSYYSKLIQKNPEWRFYDVYADEAMTGTKDNRENFQKMLAECRAGNLNLIITKSISRFARNTVTLFETVRELKDLGVDVYFEEQNIHSFSSDGELMLSILASYAQEESLSASENQKWRIRKDFEQGKVSSLQMLGYKRNHDGVLEIIPDEAEIVRLIFNSYLSGMGKLAVANMLNEQGIPTKFGNEWTADSIRRILTNEKYCGELMLQKFYSENHLTKRKMVNTGEIKKFYVEEAHPPIIEKTVFLAVQNLLKKHQELFSSEKTNTAVYPFTGKIQCGCCGKNYRRKTTATGIVWIYATYNTKGKKYCPTAKQIPENTLIGVCCDVLELQEFNVDIFENRIEKILVPAPNEVIFIFRDGREIKTVWKDRSRSESWTDEMRKAMGERSKKWHEKSQ